MAYLFVLILLFNVLHNLNAQSSFTLRKVLQSAKENNLLLKAEFLNVDIAKQDIVTAGLRPNPILNNQFLQLVQKSAFGNGTVWSDSRNDQVWWQLTKSLQIAGLRKNKIELANKNVALKQEQYEDFQHILLTYTANKWIEISTVQKKMSLITKALANIDSLAEVNNYRYQKQVITETELFRTDLLVKRYEIQLHSIEQEHSNLGNELKLLTGITDSIAIDETDDLEINVSTALDSLIEKAFQNRNDYQALVAAQKVSESNIKLQKSLAFPKPEVGIIYNPQNSVPYLGFYATLPLPVFDRNQGEIQKAKIEKEQFDARIFATQKSIETEVLNAKELYETSKANVQDFQKIIKQSDKVLINVKYAYTRGGTTIIDFLEAQRSWIETELEYYSVLQRYRQSQIQLINALGLINNL
ncbi:MAG: TolC family protein [Bacteroidetes bacterium]|nr:MAG: TolC family protein [Bacteroidota bacterium]